MSIPSDIASMIASDVKNTRKSPDHDLSQFAAQAKKAAVRKLREAIKSDDDDLLEQALDELKEMD